jgi:hypothetical protein
VFRRLNFFVFSLIVVAHGASFANTTLLDFCFAEDNQAENDGGNEMKPEDWEFILEDNKEGNNDEFKFIQDNKPSTEKSDNMLPYYFCGIGLTFCGILGAVFSVLFAIVQLKRIRKKKRTRSRKFF